MPAKPHFFRQKTWPTASRFNFLHAPFQNTKKSWIFDSQTKLTWLARVSPSPTATNTSRGLDGQSARWISPPTLPSSQTDYAAVTAKAALADAASGGAGDAKAQAETALEDAAFILARALANHFKKTNNLEKLAQVDVTKSEIVQLRQQDLLDKTTAIRDLATATVAEPGAAGRGVTPARITTLTNAINAFTAVMNLPRGQIVNRSTLLKEVDTDTADLLEQVADLDDLVLQFDGTDAGKRFIEAWKHARIIVDTGGGHAGGTPPTPPTRPRHRQIHKRNSQKAKRLSKTEAAF